MGKKLITEKIKIQKKVKFENIDCTLICTPPSSHIELAKLALEENNQEIITDCFFPSKDR